MITLTSRARVALSALKHCRVDAGCGRCPLCEECNGDINVLLSAAENAMAELLHGALIERSEKPGGLKVMCIWTLTAARIWIRPGTVRDSDACAKLCTARRSGRMSNKTPEEIKKGLEYVAETNVTRKVDLIRAGIVYRFTEDLAADSLAYIKQLEAQVPKWRNDDGSILCPYCGSTMRMVSAWRKTMPDMGGFVWCARGKCPACGSITPEMHGRTAKEANAAAYAAAQWGHVPLHKPPKEDAHGI